MNTIKFGYLMVISLLVFSCIACADYRTTLARANEAINNLEQLGTRDIELDYRDGGYVVLNGTVASEQARQRVEQAVASTRGVIGVNNQLKIVPEKTQIIMAPPVAPLPLTDQQIGQEIKQALQTSEGFDRNGLEYKVEQGRVTLMGDQNSFRAVDKILSVVLMVNGVTDVDNQMTINGGAYPSFRR